MLSAVRSGCWRVLSRDACPRVLVVYIQHPRVARRAGKYLNPEHRLSPIQQDP